MNEYCDACWLEIDIKKGIKYYDLRRRGIKSGRKIEIWKRLYRSKKYYEIPRDNPEWKKKLAERNSREHWGARQSVILL